MTIDTRMKQILSSSRLKKFDAYSKPLEELNIKTISGALLTVLSLLFIAGLSLSEYRYYSQTHVSQRLYVDVTREQKLKINLDVVFHRIACHFLSVHAMDVSGVEQEDVSHTIMKQRLNKSGMPIEDTRLELVTTLSASSAPKCLSCYGAESPTRKCCNTCRDLEAAYHDKGWILVEDSVEICRLEHASRNYSDDLVASEGCRLKGFLEVNKVAGNLHIAPGNTLYAGHAHVHDIRDFKKVKFDTTLTVNALSFGDNYPGMDNPLDQTSFNATAQHNDMFSFFVKVVPTTYISLNGSVKKSNQFSVTKHRSVVSEGQGGIPGMIVVYEISPIMVRILETRKSFMHFITSLCAIIGGVYTVSSLADAFIYHSMRAVRKKIELGKLT